MTTATATTSGRTLVEVVYATEITNIPAERDAKGNMKMKIHLDHPNRKAIFSCITREHVGKHKNRHVVFLADDECILYFSNPAVFGVTRVPLSKNKPEVRQVQDNTSDVWTEYRISVEVATAGPEAGIMQQQPLNPPRIEVP